MPLYSISPAPRSRWPVAPWAMLPAPCPVPLGRCSCCCCAGSGPTRCWPLCSLSLCTPPVVWCEEKLRCLRLEAETKERSHRHSEAVPTQHGPRASPVHLRHPAPTASPAGISDISGRPAPQPRLDLIAAMQRSRDGQPRMGYGATERAGRGPMSGGAPCRAGPHVGRGPMSGGAPCWAGPHVGRGPMLGGAPCRAGPHAGRGV
jgi:hypothetical protein